MTIPGSGGGAAPNLRTIVIANRAMACRGFPIGRVTGRAQPLAARPSFPFEE